MTYLHCNTIHFHLVCAVTALVVPPLAYMYVHSGPYTACVDEARGAHDYAIKRPNQTILQFQVYSYLQTNHLSSGGSVMKCKLLGMVEFLLLHGHIKACLKWTWYPGHVGLWDLESISGTVGLH